MDNNSLAHTKWNCKYHIVFTPKYRRQIIYKQISADIGSIIRTLCARKGVEIIEAAAMPDHIHLYVAIPPKYSVAEFVGYLKGKSSLMIFDRHSNLKYRNACCHICTLGWRVDRISLSYFFPLDIRRIPLRYISVEWLRKDECDLALPLLR